MIRTIFFLILVLFHFKIQNTRPIQPEHFALQPYHLQYIEDSIQPPPPYRPYRIQILQALLPPLILGQTFKTDKDEYLILLNPIHRDQWSTTLQHELVHVKQMAKLQLDQQDGEWRWQGQPIDWSQPWHLRPWEQAADQEAQSYIKWYLGGKKW